jgi:hypothetical protein
MIPGSGGRRIKGLRHLTRCSLIAVARNAPNRLRPLPDLKEHLKEYAALNGWFYDGDLIAEAVAIARGNSSPERRRKHGSSTHHFLDGPDRDRSLEKQAC